MQYACSTQELADYMQARWDKLPQSAKRLLNLEEDYIARTTAFIIWEMQFWREKARKLERREKV